MCYGRIPHFVELLVSASKCIIISGSVNEIGLYGTGQWIGLRCMLTFQIKLRQLVMLCKSICIPIILTLAKKCLTLRENHILIPCIVELLADVCH